MLLLHSPVYANDYYKAGVEDGAIFNLAFSLSICRYRRGDGNDWLNYYVNRLGGDKQWIQAQTRDLPEKMLNEMAAEKIAEFGSCEALLDFETKNGLEFLKNNYIPSEVRKFCESKGKC